MGAAVSQAAGEARAMDAKTARIACSYPKGLRCRAKLQDKFGGCALAGFSAFDIGDPDRETVRAMLAAEEPEDARTDRALGSILSLVCGDSLGAPLEFSPVRYNTDDLKEMGQPEFWQGDKCNRFRLKPGQWTDDASMALCLADSLLACGDLNPRHLRLQFLNWWQFGLNNAFALDGDHEGSVGLGGNIGSSMREFLTKETEFTGAGDRHTSGNGSLMRLAPLPVFYAHDREQAMAKAYAQSKTTHQGDEAAECCRLLAHLIVCAINCPDASPAEVKRSVLGDPSAAGFHTDVYAVACLAASRCEERRESNVRLNLEDRKWDWKDPKFTYSVQRAEAQPGYIGSYAMDGLSMALHCVWSTGSLQEAMLKAANLRGDADTVCAITGQLAGAIYGASAIPRDWLSAVHRWDPDDTIPLRAYKLFRQGCRDTA